MFKLSSYSLTNFKAFAEEQTVAIRPITLIYGANSSGKSSLIQSLLLLKQTLDPSEQSDAVLLSQGNLVDLGNYREFIHRHEVDRPFKVKAFFDIDSSYIQNEIQGFLNLEYRSSITVGVEIEFNYDNVCEQVVCQKIDFFLGDEPEHFISYQLDTEENCFKIQEIDVAHRFWRWLWEENKKEIKDNYISFLKEEFEKLHITTFPRSHKSRSEEIRQKLNILNDEHRTKQSELLELENKYSILVVPHTELKYQYESLEKKLVQLQRENQESQKDVIDNLESEIKRLAPELETSGTEVREIKLQIDGLESDLEKLSDSIDNAKILLELQESFAHYNIKVFVEHLFIIYEHYFKIVIDKFLIQNIVPEENEEGSIPIMQ